MKQGWKPRLVQVRRTRMVPGDQFLGHRMDAVFVLGLGITKLNGCPRVRLHFVFSIAMLNAHSALGSEDLI